MSKITDTKFEEDEDKKLDFDTTDGWYNWWLMNKQLFLIKNYADQNNIKIVNGTQGGILSYFKREPIENDLKALIESMSAAIIDDNFLSH